MLLQFFCQVTIMDQFNEDIGWCDLCLSVADFTKSIKFYRMLGFMKVEGKNSENWGVFASGNLRLGLYQGVFEGFSLNFRGGNVSKINDFLKEKQIKSKTELVLSSKGGGSVTYEDPDSYTLFFDTHFTEMGLLSSVLEKQTIETKDSLIGISDICLDVQNMPKSIKFYSQLGFKKLEGDLNENWIILTKGNLRLGLFAGNENKLLINFRGANVEKIVGIIKENGYPLLIEPNNLSNSSLNALFEDPDGYLISINSEN